MRKLSALLALALLSACAVVPPAPPPPPPPVAPPPSPQLLPATPPPPVLEWDVAALTPGDWQYRRDGSGSVASFGGASAVLTLRCNLARQSIVVTRAGASAEARSMTMRTSSGDYSWPVSGAGEVSVTLPAAERALDALAFSRGRVALEVPGMARLIVPAWAEPARVIEDCRG